MGEAKRRGTFQQRRWLAQETARRNWRGDEGPHPPRHSGPKD